MLSETPGTPGRRQHTPLTCSRTSTPAWEARYSGYFTKERCRTDLGDRTISLFTSFYRFIGDDGKIIVNSTQFEIRRKGTAP